MNNVKYFTIIIMIWLDLYVHTLTEHGLSGNPKRNILVKNISHMIIIEHIIYDLIFRLFAHKT